MAIRLPSNFRPRSVSNVSSMTIVGGSDQESRHRVNTIFDTFSPLKDPVDRNGDVMRKEGFDMRMDIDEVDRARTSCSQNTKVISWKAAVAAPKVATTRGYPWSDEVDTFWDWALLELLVQSGLRIEEASELTTFDILKRKMPDGRIYYLLHIKPSKFDRARVIPIGDGLGRVLAEIIRYVKRFYNSGPSLVCARLLHVIAGRT
jgi:integrase